MIPISLKITRKKTRREKGRDRRRLGRIKKTVIPIIFILPSSKIYEADEAKT